MISFFVLRMYDVDGNGYIDPDEMVKIVQAIYDMLGTGSVKPQETAEERAKNIHFGVATRFFHSIYIKSFWFLYSFFKVCYHQPNSFPLMQR